jgi:hypothetical protein
MLRQLKQLYLDEAAFVVSSELILVGTMLVIGMLVGLVSLRDQVVQELADTGGAMAKWTQTFSLSAVTGHSASTGGSAFIDTTDYCDYGDPIACDVDPAGQAAACISLSVLSSTEASGP